MYFDELQEDQEPDRQVRPRIDTHLNSPIRSSYLFLVKEAIKIYPHSSFDPEISSTELPYAKLPVSCTELGNTLVNLFGGDNHLCLEHITWDPSECLGTIYSSVYADGITRDKTLKPNNQIIISVLSDMLHRFDPRIDKEMVDHHRREFTDLEQAAYTVKTRIEKMKEKAILLSENTSRDWITMDLGVKGYPSIIINKSMCLIVRNNKALINGTVCTREQISKVITAGGKFFAMTYEHLLCIQDTYTSRFLCLYASRIISPIIPFKVDPDVLASVYAAFDKEFALKGNMIFAEVKLFEGLMHGLLIEVNDTLSTRHDYVNVILDEARAVNSTAIPAIYKIMRSQSSQVISEIYGLYRHWGHPIIDEPAGCAALHKIILTRGAPDPVISKEVLGCLVKQFCIQYIAKTSHWPSCDLTDVPEASALHTLIARNERRVNFYEMPIPLSEWAALKVCGALTFDYNEDFTQLLNDRSIAPVLSDEKTCYNVNMMGSSKPPKAKTSRRLLTEIINTEEIDTKKICDTISRREVPSDWYHIKLSPKEREVNIVPRLFAMMVLWMRLFFCMLESNISKNLFPYYPQQSMNNTEEKLNRRLIAMSNTTKGGSWVDVIIGIDFSKWNIHWSPFNTRIFAEFLNGLFGVLGLFDFGHEFFSQAIVSLSSAFHIPAEFFLSIILARMVKNKYRWNYHLGGLEGIMQKLWTWITIGILLLVEFRTGIYAEIVGQGDNQVCKIRIYLKMGNMTREEALRAYDAHIKAVVQEFLKTLDEIASAMGLKIKILESWVSDSVMNYGKQLFVKGACMPQLLKRLSRVLPDVNENFPTIPLRVGTLQSSGYSSAQKTYTIAIPYFISTLESCITISRDIVRLIKNKKFPVHSNMHNLIYSRSFWATLINLPSDLSTLPFINLLQYDYRGVPDDFTTYLTYLRIMIDHSEQDDDVARVLKKIWRVISAEKFEYGKPNAELLVTNPCSINYKIPERPASEFKRIVEDHLSSRAVNNNVRELFNITNREEDQALYEYLASTDPPMPRFWEIIASNSVTGTRRYIVSKFTLTKTLQSDAGVYNKMMSSEYINKFDSNTYAHLHKLYRVVMIDDDDDQSGDLCPTVLADRIRNASHHDLLHGRRIVGITVPHPAHILEIKYDDISDRREYVSLLCTNPITQESILQAGDQPAYIGSRTQEKTSGKIISVGVKSRPLTGACRISQMQKWAVDPDSQLWEFLNKLIAQRTNLSGEMLRMVAGEVTTGSAQHRMQDAVVKKSTANNFPHSFTTHFAFSSDKLDITVRGGDDYNLHINGLTHHMIRDVLKTLLTDPEYKFYYARGYRVNDCCHEAHSQLLISSDNAPPELKTDYQNKLVYSPVEVISELYVPDSMLIAKTKEVDQEHALAYYMMQRFRINTSTLLMHDETSKSPYLTRISLSEILNTGLCTLIRSFARCLYLYLGDDFKTVQHCISGMQVEHWCGLVDAALGPDILPEVVQRLGIDGIAGAYTSRPAVCRRLCDILLDEVKAIDNRKDKSKIFKNFKFFLTPNIKLSNILFMWNYRNMLCRVYGTKIYWDISKIIHQTIQNKTPWTGTLKLIVDVLLSINLPADEKQSMIQSLIQDYRIILVDGPPESFFRQTTRSKPIIMTRDTVVPSPAIRQEMLSSGYACAPYAVRQMLPNSPVLVGSLPEMSSEPGEYITARRTRLDQSYRLVGTTSTGYYKLSQMIVMEDLSVERTCVALADGEGSMAMYLAKSSNKPVIYNSLRGDGTVVTQRYEHSVPANFSCERDLVVGSGPCMYFGGDLTDMKYMTVLYTLLPPECGIVTCDAETSGMLSWDTRLNIFNGALVVSNRSNAESMIVKVFLEDVNLCAVIVSSLCCWFSKVKVICPDYSSFESSEAYVLATNRIKSNPNDFYINWREHLLVERSWKRHCGPIVELRERKMNRDLPLMADRPRMIRFYYRLGIDVGFHDNFQESISKLFGSEYRGKYRPDELLSNLRIVDSDLTCKAIQLVYSYAGTLNITIKKPGWLSCLNLTSGGSITTHLASACDRIVCAKVLRVILAEPDMIDARDAYRSYINLHHETLLIEGKPAYDYSVSMRCLEWESEHLKHIWRIYGHVHCNKIG
ncbi:MAG: RNA-dependent RNA polymerase [Pedras lispivirus]